MVLCVAAFRERRWPNRLARHERGKKDDETKKAHVAKKDQEEKKDDEDKKDHEAKKDDEVNKDDKLKTNECGNSIVSPVTREERWLLDVIDADKVFVAALPSNVELASTYLKQPPIMTTLLSLDGKIAEIQQTIRDLTPGAAQEARQLFIMSTLVAVDHAIHPK
jgi:hypothetical protein